MKKWMRLLSATLALAMMAGGFAAFAEAAIATGADGQEPILHTDADGGVYFVEGALTGDPVPDMEAAAGVVGAASDLLGGDERTQFEPWRALTDPAGNHYYVFRQMYDSTTVSGGAVKVVTDADGHMRGLVSSVGGIRASRR